MLTLAFLALLRSEFLCDMAELREKVLLIRRYIRPVDVRLLAVPDLKDVRHTCIHWSA